MLSDLQRTRLADLAKAVSFDEPMSRHTTLKIGGPADAWVAPGSVDELARVVGFCHEQKIPMVAVGGGSNLLVLDGGIRGVVLATRNLRTIERQDSRVCVQAGVSTGKLLSSATTWGLGGVEFLGGVPGSVGGGLIMNAGTFKGEFKDVTTEVTSLRLTDASLIKRTAAECEFVYRGSSLPPDEIVVEALLELSPRPIAEIKTDVAELVLGRKKREPKGASNAGSVFKNPKGDFAGRLLEDVGFKGTCQGNAECSSAHANWFVNKGGASAGDMLALIAKARQQVSAAHGIDLRLEWKCIGEEPGDEV